MHNTVGCFLGPMLLLGVAYGSGVHRPNEVLAQAAHQRQESVPARSYRLCASATVSQDELFSN